MSWRGRQQYALALLLLSLHGVVLWGFDSALTKTLLLMHYGLFLLWQPIWRGEQKLTPATALLFTIGGALLALLVNWWVLAFWIAGVFGLLGGRVFGTRAGYARLAYLLAAAYLLAILLMSVLPKLLGQPLEPATARDLAHYLLPLLPASLLFLPSRNERELAAPVLDLFYSLLLFLLTVILILGSFAIHSSGSTDYLRSLIHLLFGLAAALVLLSWLWNPRAGFAGIGQLLSRYLLTIGMPFEHWLKTIAELANTQPGAAAFIEAAMGEVAALPWVAGGTWKTRQGQGVFGATAAHQASFEFQDFQLTLYTRWPLTPALLLHIKLLTLILGEFLEAKLREESLREQAYMRAVYETGARMTHDIKNLVQSLGGLCAAARQTDAGDDAQLLALLRRQLPQLNRRLELTLDKLQAPAAENARPVKASSWWRALKQRQAGQPIEFSMQGAVADITLDANLLDNVADNLLQNALEKSRAGGSEVQIRVSLREHNGVRLEVCDDGHAMPAETAQKLFKSHVASENGLGIGLYHAARLAAESGYELTLVSNRDGEVCFALQGPPPHAAGND